MKALDLDRLSDFVLVHGFGPGAPNGSEIERARELLGDPDYVHEGGPDYAMLAAQLVFERTAPGCKCCMDAAGVYSPATHSAPYVGGGAADVCDDHLSTWFEDTDGLPEAAPLKPQD